MDLTGMGFRGTVIRGLASRGLPKVWYVDGEAYLHGVSMTPMIPGIGNQEDWDYLATISVYDPAGIHQFSTPVWCTFDSNMRSWYVKDRQQRFIRIPQAELPEDEIMVGEVCITYHPTLAKLLDREETPVSFGHDIRNEIGDITIELPKAVLSVSI